MRREPVMLMVPTIAGELEKGPQLPVIFSVVSKDVCLESLDLSEIFYFCFANALLEQSIHEILTDGLGPDGDV